MKDPNHPCQKVQPFRIEPSPFECRDQDCPQEHSPTQVDHDCHGMQKCQEHARPACTSTGTNEGKSSSVLSLRGPACLRSISTAKA